MLVAPEALRIAYLQTVLTVDGRPASDVADEMGSFWVVTAHNPLSEQLAAAKNTELHQELCGRLDEMGYQSLPALGSSPDGTWVEESIAVFGAGKRPIRALGREFNQHGVFEVTKRTLRVHGCFSRWTVQRPLNAKDWQPKSLNDRSFTEEVKAVCGVDVRPKQQRLKRHKWLYNGASGLPCRKCGNNLELFRSIHQLSSGEWRELLAVFCTTCHKAWLPDQLRASLRQGIEAWGDFLQAQRDANMLKPTQHSVYTCYVVDLVDENGTRLRKGLPWVYVGQTAKTPEERYRQHKAGIKASKWVKNYGVGLNPELMKSHLPLRTQMESLTFERFRATQLTFTGYGVKGGH